MLLLLNIYRVTGKSKREFRVERLKPDTFALIFYRLKKGGNRYICDREKEKTTEKVGLYGIKSYKYCISEIKNGYYSLLLH